jgi:hypothetical protein
MVMVGTVYTFSSASDWKEKSVHVFRGAVSYRILSEDRAAGTRTVMLDIPIDTWLYYAAAFNSADAGPSRRPERGVAVGWPTTAVEHHTICVTIYAQAGHGLDLPSVFSR